MYRCSQTPRQRCRHLAIAALAAGSFMFTACSGYTPLYQANIEAREQVMVVRVAALRADLGPGERRVAQLVGQQLRQDFPYKGDELDQLEVSIEERTTTLAVRQDATVERSQVTLSGKVYLYDSEGKELWRKSVSSRSAYNVESTPFSTESGRLFAQRTAAEQLAHEITQEVHIYYRQQAEKAATAE